MTLEVKGVVRDIGDNERLLMPSQTEIKQVADETPVEPLLLTRSQAAKTLNVSEITIWRLLQTGRLQRVPAIRRILIPQTSVRAFAATAK